MKIRVSGYVKKQLKITIFICIFSFISIILSFMWFPLNEFTANHITNPEEESVNLPVIMYHLILKNPKIKNKFVVSESLFEQDLKYLKENGFTTILIQDLIDYTEGKKNLPQKPILLTFDDGAFNNYLYAFPLAKKYESKFVFSPIAIETEKYSKIHDEEPDYAHASWKRIKEMSDSGLVEIQNHTYDMHLTKAPRVGCKRKKGESKAQYRLKLMEDVLKAQKLITENIGTTPTAFFYPFGACSECSIEFLKEMGFKATFLCESKTNKIKRDPESLFGLRRFLRPPDVISAEFFKKIIPREFSSRG